MTDQPPRKGHQLKVIQGATSEQRQSQFLGILSGMLDPNAEKSRAAFEEFDRFAERIAPRGRSMMVRVK